MHLFCKKEYIACMYISFESRELILKCRKCGKTKLVEIRISYEANVDFPMRPTHSINYVDERKAFYNLLDMPISSQAN